MTRERGLWLLAVVLLLGMAGVTLAQPSARVLTTFTAPTQVAGRERLTHAVRYSSFRLGARSTVQVGVRGDHGGVLVSLVDDRDRVREVRVAEGESVARFGAVEPGTYALRALAAPAEPPAATDSVTIRAATGGRPWALFAAAALLILAPPLVVAARKRSATRDGGATNR